jgi:hypothetical protein
MRCHLYLKEGRNTLDVATSLWWEGGDKTSLAGRSKPEADEHMRRTG